MQLEWATDAAFRFFATQPDELFGYVLHPVDLAANKASAAADRRDIFDLVTVHENILPLGAVLSAAVGKFPGVTPEEMLADAIPALRAASGRPRPRFLGPCSNATGSQSLSPALPCRSPGKTPLG
jgi:hypothetical protein